MPAIRHSICPQNAGLQQSIVIMPGTQYYPTAYLQQYDAANPGQTPVTGQPVSVSYRTFDTGPRSQRITADFYRVVLGIKGNSWGDWVYDAAFSTSASSVQDNALSGYPLQTQLVRVLNDCQCFDPTVMYQTPATAALIRTSVYDGMIIRERSSFNAVDAKTSGTIMQLPAGALSAAIGLVARQVGQDLQSSPQAANGDISGFAGSFYPYHKSRSEEAVFAEINVPIFAKLTADASLRRDQVGGVGGATSPKLSLAWRALDSLLLRGSWSRGFRAPSLVELYQPPAQSSTNYFIDNYNAFTQSQGYGTYNYTYGGNPNLKPEKSKQDALGFVWQIRRGWSLDVDYFHTKINDAIVAGDPQTIVNEANAGNIFYQGQVLRNPG